MNNNFINNRYILPKKSEANDSPRSVLIPSVSRFPLIVPKKPVNNILSEPEFIFTDFSRPLSSSSITYMTNPYQNFNRPTSADNTNISILPLHRHKNIQNKLISPSLSHQLVICDRPKFESPFIMQNPVKYRAANIFSQHVNINNTNMNNSNNIHRLPNLIPIQKKIVHKNITHPNEEPLNLVKPLNQNNNLDITFSGTNSSSEKTDLIIDYSIKLKNGIAPDISAFNISHSLTYSQNSSISSHSNSPNKTINNVPSINTDLERKLDILINDNVNLLNQNVQSISPLKKSKSEENFLSAINEFKFESLTNTESHSSLTGHESDTTSLDKILYDDDDEDEDEFIVVDFVWHDYLQQRKATAVPPNYFNHVEFSLKTEFKKGMRLEVMSRIEQDVESYWPASILMVCGQLLRLRPEGGPNNGCTDFWCDAGNTQVRQEGWAMQNNKNLAPPNSINERFPNWENIMHNYTSDISTKSTLKTLKNNSGMLVIDNIEEGMVLEVQMPDNPLLTNLAIILKNIGGRLLLKTVSITDLENNKYPLTVNQNHDLINNDDVIKEIGATSFPKKNGFKMETPQNDENIINYVEKENSIFEGSTLDYFMKRSSLSILDDHLNAYDFNKGEYLNKKVENLVDNPLNMVNFIKEEEVYDGVNDKEGVESIENIKIKNLNGLVEEKNNYNYWMFYLDPRLHCIGWANDNDCQFIPYSNLLKENKINDWCSFVERYYILADKGIPSDILDDQEDIPDHEFVVGMLMEFLNIETGKFYLTSVNKIFNEKYFSVVVIKRSEIGVLNDHIESKDNLNGLIKNDDTIKEDDDIFICSNLSLNIFPVGWCKKNSLKLEYCGENYLQNHQHKIAPSEMFYQLKKSGNNFSVGMMLEVVNSRNGNEICVATIEDVKSTLLFISFDHEPSHKTILPYKSFEIFPVGWCDCNNWPLTTPLMKIKKKKVPTATLR